MHDPTPPSHDDPPSGPVQPYLDWARDTDFSYLNRGDWIPLLVEFDPDIFLEEFIKLTWLQGDLERLKDDVAVADFFAKPPEVLKKHKSFNFCILLARRHQDVFARLTGSKGWNLTILNAHIGPPFDPTDALPRETALPMASGEPSPSSAPVPSPAPPSASPPPVSGSPPPSGGAPPASPPIGGGGTSSGPNRRVVVAVIDQGIAFASNRFTDAAGNTRIAYLWQQAFLGRTIPPLSSSFTTAPGVELTASAINAARTAARAIGAGDDWIYTKRGGVDFSVEGYKPLAQRRAHGTHVLDLAAGNLDLAAGLANPSPHTIIAVDMPEDAVGDPAGSTLSVHAAWGLLYVMSRAEMMRNKPNETLAVVANLSYGPHEGSHEGMDLFERFMDQLVNAYRTSPTPLKIVLAAGNYKQSRIHAAPPAGAGAPPPLQWRLQPGSLSPSMMEVWLSRNLNALESVTLQPPTGTPITVSSGTPRAKFPAAALPGAIQYSATYIQKTTPGPGGVRRAHVVLAIARTAVDPSSAWGAPTVESGIWTVQVNALGVQLKAWIKRSDTQSGRRAKGRQSYFDDGDYERFAKGGPARSGRPLDFDESPRPSYVYVTRYQTLSGIATGAKTIVVGGYCESEQYPAMYSSHGTRGAWGPGAGPDCLAVSDDSRACRGALAAGIMSGSVVSMNGTSVAAPQVTRLLADYRMATGVWPPAALPGLVPLPAPPPWRPIPAGELAAARGGGLLPALPRRIPRR
jgi:hypothetical protein